MVKNKSKIAGVIAAAALIAFSATSCGDNGGGGVPGGQLGDGPLILSGQVQTVTWQGGNPVFTDFTGADPVPVTAYRSNLGGTVLGSGMIGGTGQLSITLTSPAADALESASNLATAIYGGASAADTTAQGIMLALYADVTGNNRLSRVEGTATVYRNVRFVYVNAPATINIPQSSQGGFTTNAATLNLAAGWNAIYQSDTTSTRTFSVGNPPLRWIIGDYMP